MSDQFEKELFDQLGDYDSPLDSLKEWHKLESQLEKKNDRKYPFLFPFIGGVLIFGIVAFSLWQNTISLENDNANDFVTRDSTKPIVEQMTTKIDKEDVTNISNSIAKSIIPEVTTSEQNKTLIVESNATSTTQTSLDTQNIYFQTPQDIAKSNSVYNKPLYETNATNQSGKIDETDLNEKQNFTPKHTGKQAGTKSILSNQTRMQIKIASLDKNLNTFSLDNAPAFNKQIQFAMVEGLVDSHKDVIESNYKSWQIGLAGSFGLPFISRTTTNQDAIDIDWINDYEEAYDFSDLEIKVYKQINRNISVYSGLNASLTRSSFEYKDSRVVSDGGDMVVTERLVYLDGSIEEKKDSIALFKEINIDAKLWQKYWSVNVPIGISFHTAKSKRFYLQGDLGTSISVFRRHTGTLIRFQDNAYNQIANNEFKTSMFGTLRSDVFVGANLNNDWDLLLGISGAFDLNSRLNVDAKHSFKLNALAARLGIMKRF